MSTSKHTPPYSFRLVHGRDDVLIKWLAELREQNWVLSDIMRYALHTYAEAQGMRPSPPVDINATLAYAFVALLDKLEAAGVTREEIARTADLDAGFMESMRELAREGTGRRAREE